MNKISAKNIIFLSLCAFLFLFVFWPHQTFGQRELEVQYPEIFGFKPETIATLLPDYVRYIFNFTLALIGFIAFAVLIYAGIRYLTSAGNPEEQKKARQQIKSAAFGILILLFSYLILTTINPQLVVFQQLTVAPTATTTLPEIPISPVPTADLLGRIKELAQAVKQVLDPPILSTAQAIKELTDNCDCATTQPFCLVKQYRGGSCEAEFCYAASDDQPCPDIQEIRENQQRLVDLRDVILYYKNRALAETGDLTEDLEKFINVKLEWYEDKISAEKRVLDQCDNDACRALQQSIIDSLEKDKGRLEIGKGYKEELRVKLGELTEAVKKIEEPATELAALPDQCLANVRTQCQGSCSGGGHDTTGCFPVECSGGNPCPTGDIQAQVNEILSIVSEIKRIADEIISIVDAIPKEL